MSGVTVRPATRDDLPRVAEVWVRSWQTAYAGIVPAEHLASLDPAVRLRRLIQMFEHVGYEMVVAEVSATVVGFAVGGPWRGEDAAPELAEVTAIYLDPASTGRGIGRMLLAAAEGRLAERGFADARLWVLEGNRPAQGFYRSAGWAADGVRQDYEIAGASLPEVRYARRLSGTTTPAEAECGG